MAKATIREQRTDSSLRIILALKEESALFMKKGDFTEEEQFRFDMALRAMFRDAEAFTYQRRQGLFDDSEWKAMDETYFMINKT